MPKITLTKTIHNALPQGFLDRLVVMSKNRAYKRTKALRPEQYRAALGKWFYRITGEELDVDNPTTFNQKIQWLKLYDSTEEKGRLADKYLVRAWIEEQLGPDYLVPLLGQWPDAASVDFDSLPQAFVLKTTLGSNTNIFVKDKSKLDIAATRKQLDEWLRTDFAFANGSFELHYSYYPPRVIAEEYMDVEAEPGGGLADYRFYSSWGNVFVVMANNDGSSHDYARSVFTPDWEELQVTTNRPRAVPPIEKPKHYDEMLEVARKLSSNFAFARVDLYEYQDHVRFGEITFTPQSGASKYNPHSFEEWMGSNVILPTEKKPYKGVML